MYLSWHCPYKHCILASQWPSLKILDEPAFGCASNGTVCEVPASGLVPSISPVWTIPKRQVWASHGNVCKTKMCCSGAP